MPGASPVLAPSPSRGHTLNEVRAVIPEACYERPRARALVTVGQAALLYAAPLVGLILTNRWWLLIPLWIFAALGVAGLFVIGHDASHGALTDANRLNRLIAWFCMIPSAHVEAAWDLGHNRIHHGYTTRQGFDFVWHPVTVDEYRALGRLGRIRHRLEWSSIGSGAYYLRTVWWNKMMWFAPAGQRAQAIRRDRAKLVSLLVALVALTSALAWLDGSVSAAIWVPIKVLVIPFLLFVQIIAWTVYVHHVAPDIRWWPRKEWTQYKGQMESTTVIRLPRLVNKLWFHNIFVHVPHHVDPRIPFHQLPAAARAIDAAYPGVVRSSRFSVPAFLRAAHRCKLYDFENGCWLPYRAAALPA